MRKFQRLILCLDGTWNQQDHSTNVLHHFNLVRAGSFHEGPPGAKHRRVTQKKQYFRGVGTGPLDRLTGGGFGFGLEQNVRDAYNWLVENFNDGGNNPKDADEIYIFGFSRGAYTARSLVGLIGAYGLLKRGSPQTVQQLWGHYCILGRRREGREGIWEKVFGDNERVPRQISEYVIDPWLADTMKTGASRQLAEPDATERLLMEWSRRVKITYLGIYDTVGAIGWDALDPGIEEQTGVASQYAPDHLDPALPSCFGA